MDVELSWSLLIYCPTLFDGFLHFCTANEVGSTVLLFFFCSAERLRNFHVGVGSTKDALNSTSCAFVKSFSSIQLSIHCSLKGRFVAVWLTEPGILTLCEVEVYGRDIHTRLVCWIVLKQMPVICSTKYHVSWKKYKFWPTICMKMHDKAQDSCALLQVKLKTAKIVCLKMVRTWQVIFLFFGFVCYYGGQQENTCFPILTSALCEELWDLRFKNPKFFSCWKSCKQWVSSGVSSLTFSWFLCQRKPASLKLVISGSPHRKAFTRTANSITSSEMPEKGTSISTFHCCLQMHCFCKTCHPKAPALMLHWTGT